MSQSDVRITFGSAAHTADRDDARARFWVPVRPPVAVGDEQPMDDLPLNVASTSAGKVKRCLRPMATLAALVVSAVYVYTQRAELTLLTQVEASGFLALCAGGLLFFGLSAWTFAALVSLVGVRLSMFEAFGLSLLTNFGNYLGPARPGAALKAVYLKRAHGLAYTRFASVLVANACLVLMMSGVSGLAALAWVRRGGIDTPQILWCVCVVSILGSLIPFVVRPPRLPRRTARLRRLVESAVEGFDIIRTKRFGLVKVCLLVIAQFILAAGVFQVTFAVLGFPLSFHVALLIGVFTSMMNFFTITPNNIGLQEAVTAYLFSLSGFDFSVGVIGAGLIRMIHILITFGLTPVLVYFMLKPASLSVGHLVGWRPQNG